MHLGYCSTCGARWVYTYLANFSGEIETKFAVWLSNHFDDDLVCWPSLSGFAEWSGCDVRSARRAMRRLQARGFIEEITEAQIPNAKTRERHAAGRHHKSVKIYRALTPAIGSKNYAQGCGAEDCPVPKTRTRVPKTGAPVSDKLNTEISNELRKKGRVRESQNPVADAPSAANAAPPSQVEQVDGLQDEIPDWVTADWGSDPHYDRRATNDEPAQPEPADLKPGQCKATLPAGQGDLLGDIAPVPAKPGQLSPDAMRKAWNDAVKGTGIPRAMELDDRRRRRLQAIAKSPCNQSMANWERICKFVAGDPFHRGERNGEHHPNWRSSLDYIIRPGVALKILEDLHARWELHEADRKQHGIYTPQADDFAQPAPLSVAEMQALHRPEVDGALHKGVLPVLTMDEILSIEPGLKNELPAMKSAAEEAEWCRLTVKLMVQHDMLPDWARARVRTPEMAS